MTTPRIITAAELMDLTFPEPRWAVPGLVPEGLTVMAGKPKLGKSWLALGIAVAVACGGRVLGNIKVDQGEVLYLALEDSGRRLQSRLSILLGSEKAPSGLYLAHQWPRGEEGVEAIADWLQSHDEARLVTIDTLARFRAQRRNGRGYDDDCEDLVPLHKLANEERAAIKFLHHNRKMSSFDWIDELSGTLGIAGTADGLMGLFRARGEQEAELKVTGRDIEERELGLRFDPNAGTWVSLGEAGGTIGLSPERREMVAAMELIALAGKPPASARELAKHLRRFRDFARNRWPFGQSG